MRKFWIDTDTASDDAVAILMALRWPDVHVEGISVVAGNVPVEMGGRNARYTVELCGRQTPVYLGLPRPLLREPSWAYFFHGPDGMGGIYFGSIDLDAIIRGEPPGPAGIYRLAVDGTSRLSAHLHFGELTPARVWRETMMLTASYNKAGLVRGAETFQRELLWREFAHHVLHHFPKTPERPLDARFAKFPWRRSASLLHAWQRGETGIPVVDAGMRELMTTGAMHNRARLIVASFLTRHLRFHWREGARWFRESLVDADLANNTLNWRWVAGCGADAAPYFRIFNPVLQSRKFDPGGEYLARWLPALKKLPARYRHAPWLAPARVLAVSGLRLGKDYPYPVIDLDLGRAGALDAFRRWRRHAP